MIVQEVLTKDLHPNDYNANVMKPEEFEELLSEIRRLGKIPKPIIVRENSGDYEIVDGEHNWRAAQEAGLDSVPCEIIKADNFEGMLQSYKRNQHGTHNPIKLGKMFQRMMEEKGLSQRALAEEIEVSEGTIRNALMYVKAEERAGKQACIDEMNIRGIRWYLALPEKVADAWLRGGAKIDDLYIKNAYTEWQMDSDFQMENVIKKYEALTPLFEMIGYSWDRSRGFKGALKKVFEIMEWERKWCGNRSVDPEELRKYSKFYFIDKAFRLKTLEQFEDILRLIINPGQPSSFYITSEEVGAVLKESEHQLESYSDFRNRIVVLIQEKTGKLIKDRFYTNHELMEQQLQASDAPEYIKKSEQNIEVKMLLSLTKAGKGYWAREDCSYLEEAIKKVAETKCLWYQDSPGWSLEQALNWSLKREITRIESEKMIRGLSNIGFAKKIVDMIGIYSDESLKEKTYMIATLEQLKKIELYALFNMLRNASSWMDRTAMIKVLAEQLKGA